MEENFNIIPAPKYTMRWLGNRVIIACVFALIMCVLGISIGGFASMRVDNETLSKSGCDLVQNALAYCFALVGITSMTLILAEVAFRKEMNYLQYILIDCALTLFYMLLLSMSELMPFWAAYAVAAIMTIGLIVWFVNGITASPKAVKLIGAVIVAEFALMFLLINLGSLALLIGTLSLFALIAVAMYFTLKLRIENGELILK